MIEPTAERPEPIEEYGTDAIRTIDPSHDEETIVPVRIVESGRAREIRMHRGWNVTIPGSADAFTDGETIEIVGGNEDRRRLYVYNTSVDGFVVTILQDNAQSAFMGYPLSGLTGLEIFSEGPVYAVCHNQFEPVLLGIHEEYSVPEL